jgi:DHA2 family multidrug resistance protein
VQALLRPLIERAAQTQAINDAWAVVAVLTVVALLCVPFAGRAGYHEAQADGRRSS